LEWNVPLGAALGAAGVVGVAAVELLLDDDGVVEAAPAELLTRAAPIAPPPRVEPTNATAMRPFRNGFKSISPSE
jgi:hypothetical protein